MPIPAHIVERIETFGRNLESYLNPEYKETQLRREFLDPLFDALGWDVGNRAGYAEAYKDVVHEDSLKIPGLAATAPDYSFRIGGTRKFFVEAKKPSVKIKDDPAPAAQLRRYSYSAKLSLGIVTDFQEFAVYDTRQRPRENDKASAGRIFYCTYEQFAEKWDEIAGIFSREAVLRGSFDKFAATAKGKRGTSEFDDDFLADMEAWRDLLARNLALRNTLTQRELNFAVQRILDRLIFLRIAEDRGIEPYGQLQALTNGGKIYPRFCEICERADFRYNSGLFHFAAEKGRDESPDKLTLRLVLDDAAVKEIISALYWPKSPYAFAVIPADILGHIYEQFLGKIIHLTSDHRAVVEEKPEVRKAGGVYYTPTYIVNYIVEQTVGPLVKDRAPKQVEQLKILDPACGSGSFLLGAYEFLLAWHLDYYLKHDPAAWAKKKNPPVYETAPNAHGIGQGSKNFLLTTAERKRILVNNLFGVDIDAQAVEVTKLSLLLKVLEGEARELQGKQLDFHRVLPDLGNNIKCGNSLVGSDFYSQPNLPDFDEDARYKINAFDWSVEFKPIIDAGGFDAVIGNPPYLNVDETWGKKDPRTDSLRRSYPEVYNDKTDLLFYFLARAQTLSRGRVTMIVSRAFLEAFKADKLRGFLARSTSVEGLIDFQNFQVFPNVGITTCIVSYSTPRARGHVESFRLLGNLSEPARFSDLLSDSKVFENVRVDRSALASAPWVFRSQSVASLNAKIDGKGDRLDQLLVIGQGMQTGRNEAFTVTLGDSRDWKLPSALCYLRASNSDIQRYHLNETEEVLIYPEEVADFEELPPPVQAKLKSEESKLKKRAAYVRGNCQWWKYTWPLHREYYNRRRILCPFLARENRFAFAGTSRRLGLTDTTVLFENDQPESMLYLLGLLNSKLLTFRFQAIGKLKSGGIYEYFWNSISKLVIRRIDFSKKSEKSLHDTLVAHVERILKLHADLAEAKSPDAQTRLQRDIAATDRAIDQLVYQLYNLTPEEIALVEQATAPVVKSALDESTEPPAPAAAPPPPAGYTQAEADAAHHYFAKKSPPTAQE